MDLGNKDFRKNCIIGGDFNTNMGQKEKRGGSLVHDPFQESMEGIIHHLLLLYVKPLRF